jgi:hypothetical protein
MLVPVDRVGALTSNSQLARQMQPLCIALTWPAVAHQPLAATTAITPLLMSHQSTAAISRSPCFLCSAAGRIGVPAALAAAVRHLLAPGQQGTAAGGGGAAAGGGLGALAQDGAGRHGGPPAACRSALPNGGPEPASHPAECAVLNTVVCTIFLFQPCNNNGPPHCCMQRLHTL